MAITGNTTWNGFTVSGAYLGSIKILKEVLPKTDGLGNEVPVVKTTGNRLLQFKTTLYKDSTKTNKLEDRVYNVEIDPAANTTGYAQAYTWLKDQELYDGWTNC